MVQPALLANGNTLEQSKRAKAHWQLSRGATGLSLGSAAKIHPATEPEKSAASVVELFKTKHADHPDDDHLDQDNVVRFREPLE